MEEKHVLLQSLWNILALLWNELSPLKWSTATFISLLSLISSYFFQVNVCDFGISFHTRTFGLLTFILQSTAHQEEKVLSKSDIHCLAIERPFLGHSPFLKKILAINPNVLSVRRGWENRLSFKFYKTKKRKLAVTFRYIYACHSFCQADLAAAKIKQF